MTCDLRLRGQEIFGKPAVVPWSLRGFSLLNLCVALVQVAWRMHSESFRIFQNPLKSLDPCAKKHSAPFRNMSRWHNSGIIDASVHVSQRAVAERFEWLLLAGHVQIPGRRSLPPPWFAERFSLLSRRNYAQSPKHSAWLHRALPDKEQVRKSVGTWAPKTHRTCCGGNVWSFKAAIALGATHSTLLFSCLRA